MKKNILKFATLLLASAIFIGCLKDKGFDNQEYGIKDPSGNSLGISFPQAPSSPILGSLNSLTTEQTLSTDVNLESASFAATDVIVQIVSNPTLVASAGYNAIPSGGVIMPTSVTIKAGTRLVPVTLRIPNSSLLDATKIYAVGLSISSVSPSGYTIASNLKNIVMAFSIKNKYDGVYQLRGYHNRNIPDYTAPYNVKIHLVTTGPNSVVTFYPAPPGPNVNAHPINGSGGAYYGTFAPEFTFNTTTNACTAVQMWSGYAPLTMGLLGTTNRYVPGVGATPAMAYLAFNYNGNPLRSFFDTLTYIGPRP